MKSLIFVPIFFCLTGMLIGKNMDSLPQRSNIIKTNVLNLIMLPSVHFEGQIAEKTGLQLNLHRGSIVFLTPNEWLNSSVIARRYFSKKGNMQGLYAGAGITFHHNYLKTSYDTITQMSSKSGASFLGTEFRLGYQTKINKSRWYFDGNIGYSMPFISLNNRFSGEESQGRLMLGVGYLF